MKRYSLLMLVLIAAVATGHAQLTVTLEAKRRSYLRGEPIEVTVNIRNLAGHDITLRDVDTTQWFGFDVHRGNSFVGPYDAKYRNPPLRVLSGDTVSRSVDLLQLFPVNERGGHSVRATIFFHETGKYHNSNALQLNISEGRELWSRTVGVPDGKEGAGGTRLFELIGFQHPKEETLYCRVSDQTSGTILAAYPLGRLLTGASAMGDFSDENTLYAFHMSSPGTYALSKVGVNGEWEGQSLWISKTGRATVRRRDSDGKMVVLGAHRDMALEGAKVPRVIPKLSDGPPVAIPGDTIGRNRD